MTADEELRVPAEAVHDVVDTNGAGDAFASGFLLAHLAGHGLRAAVEAGHRQAAACLRSPGSLRSADRVVRRTSHPDARRARSDAPGPTW